MVAPLESAVVRIRKQNGAIVGAGFLIHEKYILTCAHVVAQALGISESTPQRPSESIHLDFPLITPDAQLKAQVIFWRPAPAKGDSSQGHEDIAALELDSPPPPDAKPVRLLLENDLWNHPFQTFGFPAGHDDGLWSTGVLRARQGTGWVQVEDVKAPGGRLESGYSGAPVWDEKLNGVVGMAVAADLKRTDAKIAFIIPTRVLATNWTALSQLTIPPLTLTGKKPNHALQWALAGLFGIATLGASTLLIPQVRDRLGLGEAACFREAERKGEKAIVVTEFYNEPGTPIISSRLRKKIVDRLRTQGFSKVRVCLTAESVSLQDEARALGKRHNAAIVVWGSRGGTTFDVYVTSVDLNTRYLTNLSLAASNPSDFGVETEDWAQLVTLMTAFHLSQIYKELESNLPESFETLSKAVEVTRLMRSDLNLRDQNTTNVLSGAYYFLGHLYRSLAGKDCSKSREACLKALNEYQQAFSLDKTLDQAIINQGRIQEQLGNLPQAIAVWTQLIIRAPESDSALEVRQYIADVYIRQGKFDAAIADLKFVSSRQPNNIDCLRLLGIAQVQARQTSSAQSTYRQLIQNLSQDRATQIEVIDDLKALASRKPELQPIIETILREI
jgi:tetratricopeptide (TPR) repeat protein